MDYKAIWLEGPATVFTRLEHVFVVLVETLIINRLDLVIGQLPSAFNGLEEGFRRRRDGPAFPDGLLGLLDVPFFHAGFYVDGYARGSVALAAEVAGYGDGSL